MEKLTGRDGGKKGIESASEAEQIFLTTVITALNRVACFAVKGYGSPYSRILITEDAEVAAELSAHLREQSNGTVPSPFPPGLEETSTTSTLLVQFYESNGDWYLYAFPPSYKPHPSNYLRKDQPILGFSAEDWLTNPYEGMRVLDIWYILREKYGEGSEILRDFNEFGELVRRSLYEKFTPEEEVAMKVEMSRLRVKIGPQVARALVADMKRAYFDHEGPWLTPSDEPPDDPDPDDRDELGVEPQESPAASRPSLRLIITRPEAPDDERNAV
ncbi:hypothetical protein CO046_02560 [Candidatus Peregrinibacteria bacterium CG_4_9_14_0_2_um_filter_53_11]|nr:MAG: hypothetical protein CO046_02560 [Candidatus Peregrinibacteria bacterium CG_4_9_14_0_2_um_filter_53_11]